MNHSPDQNDQDPLGVTRVSNRSGREDPRVTAAMEIYLQELEAGRVPDRDEFLARYPEIADQLVGLDFLHGVAPQVAGQKATFEGSEDHRLSPRATLGDFQLIRQIGQGGMGVVYEAEQLSLGRRVAVKVLPFAAMLNEQHRKRFQNEARAAATLDHPNIVPVYFVGQERGVHFFAMQLIEGQSMAELIDGMRGEQSEPTALAAGAGTEDSEHGPRLAPSAHNAKTSPDFRSAGSTQRSKRPDEFFRTVARLGAEAAEALEHAHQLGILHRDIKPGNLLIDTAGKLWVADFGLATIEHGETLTRTGGVVGTAAYMSPEQASDSRRIHGTSDVYSLGATMYELLTLRIHRSDDQTIATSIHHVTPEAVQLSRIDAMVPSDLETIVIKALSVDPTDRYQTAAAMAADLRSFMEGREIKARRLTLVQRQARWIRRHRRLTTGAIAASFLLIAAFGTVMSVYSRQLASRGRDLQNAVSKADESRLDAEKQSLLAKQRLERAERSEQAALSSEQAARRSEKLARRMSYSGDTQRAYEGFKRHSLVDASRFLARQIPESDLSDLRGVEWRLLNAEVDAKRHLLGSHVGPATVCALYPDGTTVATAGEDGLIHVWDTAAKTKLKSFEPKIGSIQAMAISPDGKTIAVGGAPSAGLLGSAKVHLLDAENGSPKAVIQKHKTTIESIQFSPDGNWIAAGSRYEDIQLSTIDGKKLHSFLTDTRNETFAFSPDSKILASTVKRKRLVRFWNCENGDLVKDNPFPDFASSISWSPVGDYIAVAGKAKPIANVLDGETGAKLADLKVSDSEKSRMHAITVSADGRTISAGDSGGKLHQWQADVDAWRNGLVSEGSHSVADPSVDPLEIDSEQFTSMVQLASGLILSTHDSGHVRLTHPRNSAARIHAFDFDITAAISSPDSTIFLGSSNGTVHQFHSETGNVTQIMQASGAIVKDLAVNGDGSRLAVLNDSGRVALVNPNTQGVLWSQPVESDAGQYRFRVALSADGRVVAVAGHDNQLTVWDTTRQEPILMKQFPGHGWSVAVSPDGRLVARGGENIDVFQVTSGESLNRFRGAGVSALQFSPDSRYLASGHDDGSIRLHEVASGEEHIIRGNSNAVRGLAFSADGRTILSADVGDGPQEVHLWDTDTREEFGSIINPLPACSYNAAVMFKIFAFNGRVIVCSINAPYAKIAVWDLAQ